MFFEAIRIIKEMRESTDGKYPTFAVWENVPGAFSSNKGEDFRCILEEFVHVCDEKLSVPRPANGRWNTAGEIVGDGFSVAWRQLDAQYWGVPQRRKRIYLVADFAGGRAGEILFERESMRWNPAPGRAPGQGAAADAARSAAGSAGELIQPCVFNESGQGYWMPGFGCLRAEGENRPSRPGHLVCFAQNQRNEVRDLGEHSGALAANARMKQQSYLPYALHGNGIDRAETAGCNGKGWREDVCYTLNTIDRPAICFKAGNGAKARSIGVSEKVTPTLASEEGGNSVPSVCYPQVARTLTEEADASPCIDRGQNFVCYDARGNGDGAHCPTLTGDHERRVTDYTALCIGHGELNSITMANQANTLSCMHDQQAILISGKPPRKYIIRRLTPLECCRLQGFPDGWGVPDHKDRLSDEELAFWQQVRDTSASIAGKHPKKYSAEALTKWYNGLHTDSAEYKMWGNGIALPCAAFVLGGVAEELGIRPKEALNDAKIH